MGKKQYIRPIAICSYFLLQGQGAGPREKAASALRLSAARCISMTTRSTDSAFCIDSLSCSSWPASYRASVWSTFLERSKRPALFRPFSTKTTRRHAASGTTNTKLSGKTFVAATQQPDLSEDASLFCLGCKACQVAIDFPTQRFHCRIA